MQVVYDDFNGATALFNGKFANEWAELDAVLSAAPVPLKGSLQAGKVGDAIYDPVGSNEHIKTALTRRGWTPNVALPPGHTFLGLDVDFVRNGLLVEVQYSNYPFLLNNVTRSEMLMRSGVALGGGPIEALVIVAKSGMFPSSNSSLYYEQAKEQIAGLAQHGIISIPVRLVGLMAPVNVDFPVEFVTYAGRTSRTVLSVAQMKGRFTPRKSGTWPALTVT